ncbi:hypothetical protein Tco_1509718 [Tanacetum coccineum]
MALSGKLIGYVEISKTGGLFHDLFRHKPHEMVAITPDKGFILCATEVEGVGTVDQYYFGLHSRSLFYMLVCLRVMGRWPTWTFELEQAGHKCTHSANFFDELPLQSCQGVDAHRQALYSSTGLSM